MKLLIFFNFFGFLHGIEIVDECESFLKTLINCELIQDLDEDKIYLNPKKLLCANNTLSIQILSNLEVDIPYVNFNKKGFYIDYAMLSLVCTNIVLANNPNISLCAKRENSSNKKSNENTQPAPGSTNQKSNEELYQEAKKHYAEAQKELANVFIHALGAAGSLETLPPLAIIEVYRSAQSIIKMSDAYLLGRDLENKCHKTSARSDWTGDPNNHCPEYEDNTLKLHD